MPKKISSPSYSFKGYDFSVYLKEHKELLVVVSGAVLGYVATSNPAFAGLTAALSDLIVAALEYWVKKR